MTTIDNRVTKIDFDNKSFETNVATSVKTLDNLKKGLNLTESTKSLNALSAAGSRFSMSGIEEGVRVVSERFSTLGIIGMTVLQNLTTAAMNLGQQMLNQVVLAPLKMGFQEYETQMNAIQTVLANTQSKGTTLDDVNAALETLNEYSDKTIYNFTEMARNIGTFTAAGISLETSTSAIKGIANLAAVSGSNSQQAATAMYQLSQALSSGTVKLMDWNSVVNAGMGGQVFQDALKETARVHGIAIDDMVKSEGSFRETLQKGWLTSEILTETLSKFTGDLNEEQLKTMGYTQEQIVDILKLGQTANDAATKVKTFSQLTQTLMEALQSGWAKTWQLIIGDFEEAKSFMTEISDTLGALIGQSSDTRNALFEGWKKVGGRANIIEALRNTFEALMKIVTTVSGAIKDVFPPITYRQLQSFSLALQQFTKKLIISDESAKSLGSVVRALASTLSLIFSVVGSVIKGLGRLIGVFKPAGSTVDKTASKFNYWILTLKDAIDASDIFNKITDKMVGFLEKVKEAFGKFVVTMSNTFKAIKTKFVEVFNSIDTSGITALVDLIKKRLEPLFAKKEGVFDAEKLTKSGGPLATIIKGIMWFINFISEKIKKFVDWIVPIFKSVGDFFGRFFKSLGDAFVKGAGDIEFDGMIDIINAGLLAALVTAVVKFITTGTKTIGQLSGSVSGLFNSVSKVFGNASGILDGVRKALVAWQTSIQASTLLKIAAAVAILAAALIALSLVDSKKLGVAIGAVTVMFADLLGSMALFNKIDAGPSVKGLSLGLDKASTMMISLSISMLLLAGALVRIAELDPKQITAGMIAIEILMASMIGFSIIISKNARTITAGMIGFIQMAIALGIMTGVVEKLGNLDVAVLQNGLVSIGVLLAELSAFMIAAKMGAMSVRTSASLMIVAGALVIMAAALQILSKIEPEQLVNTVAALGALLAGLAIFTASMGKGNQLTATALNMAVMSYAMIGFATAIETLSKLSLAEIGKGLLAMAGIFLVIIGVMKLLPIPQLLVASVALVIISGALILLAQSLTVLGSMTWDEIARGLVALAGSLLIFAGAMYLMTAGLPGAAAMLVMAGAIALLVPSLMILGKMSLKEIGIGLLALVGVFVILGVAGLVLAPLIPVLLALAAVLALLGVAALAVGVGMLAFATGLALLAASSSVGAIALKAIILSLVTLIPIVLIKIGQGIVLLILELLKAIPIVLIGIEEMIMGIIEIVIRLLPKVVEAVFVLITTLLESLALHLPAIIQAGYDILLAFLTGIANNIGGVVTAAFDIVINFMDAVAEKLPEIIESGWELIIAFIDGLTASVEENMPTLMTSVTKLGIAVVEGFAQGIRDSVHLAWDAVKEVGQAALDGLKEALNINSPSKKFIPVGSSVVEGFALGISNNTGLITKPIKDLAKTSVSTLGDAIRNISSLVSDGMDLTPTIRPVIDLTDVMSGKKQLSDLFEARNLNVSLSADKIAQLSKSISGSTEIQNGSNLPQNTGTTVSLTQINNSPKALSHLEIYRQTQNQLRELKGLVRN